MRREPGSIVKESSRNHPETDLAPPHRVLLSPCPELHTNLGCRLLARLWVEALMVDGDGGCVTKDRVWFSWLRSTGRSAGSLLVLLQWHCVRQRSSARSPRLPRNLTTASAGRLTRGTSPVTPAGTTPIVTPVIIAASRADRAGTPAWRKCRRGALRIAMPAWHRAPLPAAWHHRADSVHRTSSPKRAVSLAAIRRGVAACGAPGS